MDSVGKSARDRSEVLGFVHDARTRVETPDLEPWRRVPTSGMARGFDFETRSDGKGAARLLGISDHTLDAFRTTAWYRDQGLHVAAATEVVTIRRPPGCVFCVDHPHSCVARKTKH